MAESAVGRALLEIAKQYARECTDCEGRGVVEVARDHIGGETFPVEEPCRRCAAVRRAIAKAEAR